VEGTVIDLARWPSGMIPVHSTFSEWQQSPMAAGLACQGCHMPPADPSVTNGADLQAVSEASTGITAGWPRPPGSTRLHTWAGPKSPQDARLPSPLTLQLEKGLEQGVLTASVTVTNVGAGHAIPTGEPMRAVVVLVEAYCEETPLVATGGDSVSDIGGALDWREADQGFDTWPGAKVGEVIRVVSRSGERVDYEGFGPFGDGTFSLEEKGLWVEQVVGQSVITAIDGETVSLSAPLPLGDRAYRASSDAWAGLPGFAFARVLVGPDGQRMVPHFRAVDVVSDNRLLPGKSWTSNHAFISTCEAPTIEVRVMGRAVPLYQSRLHGWELRDTTLSTLTE
jgi:hypothetical protein